MAQGSVGAAGGGGRVRVARTGLAVVHRGEMILPTPGSEATVESVDGQVHYHFPVEIEVRGAAEAADIEALIDRALVRLAQAVENR